MSEPLTIGSTSRDGRLRIVDTAWDSNGTLCVTVEDLAGVVRDMPIEAMRRLARRCLMYPEKTRSARTVRKGCGCPCGRASATFAVSRLES